MNECLELQNVATRLSPALCKRLQSELSIPLVVKGGPVAGAEVELDKVFELYGIPRESLKLRVEEPESPVTTAKAQAGAIWFSRISFAQTCVAHTVRCSTFQS